MTADCLADRLSARLDVVQRHRELLDRPLDCLGGGDLARCRAGIDAARRQSIVLHHSATHLMHAALREVLGEHVTQKGSLVAPDRLRFDFSHFQAMTDEEIRRVEDLVNRAILANHEVRARHEEIPDDKTLIILCDAGTRSYEVQVFLDHIGKRNSLALSGGFNVIRRIGADWLG
mgnify:CR=1 FL=1